MLRAAATAEVPIGSLAIQNGYPMVASAIQGMVIQYLDFAEITVLHFGLTCDTHFEKRYV